MKTPIHERIMHQRGERPVQEQGDGAPPIYRAFMESPDDPQAAFVMYQRGGMTHLFQYHHLENAEHHTGDRGEYVTFTHRGKSVVMRGRFLLEILLKLQAYRIAEIKEYDESIGYYEDAPLIDRIHVTNLNAEPDLSMGVQT